MKLLSRLNLVAVLLTAGGCLGGGESGGPAGSGPPPPPPAASARGGLWSGAVSWEPKDGFAGGALNVRAIVAETGEFRLVLYPDAERYFASPHEQIFGNFDIDGRDVATATDSIWAGPPNATSDDWAAFEMTGRIEPGQSISGVFEANWDGWTHVEERAGTLSLNYHSLYESPSSLGILQGTYGTPDEVLTIDAQGNIFYQSSVSGCAGNGRAEIIDPKFNMYRVEIAMDACTADDAIRNGLTFTGLANIGENNDASGGFLNATLEMAVSATMGLPFSTGYIPWNLRVHRN